MNFFITGTDTEIGKTYVTELLLRDLHKRGIAAAGYKPIACGDRQDARRLRAACAPSLSLDEINPLYLRTPTAPCVAAAIERQSIDLSMLAAGYEYLAARHEQVLVEGAGGWEVPLCPGKTVADLARMLDLPVLLVVGNRLGAVNHALLTVKSIASSGLACRGIILNHSGDEWDTAALTNKGLIEEFSKLPVLAELIHGQDEIDSRAILGA
ncbi:MAG: dethiobiotin synthase [Akkermansia sp.]|nr:dethiobiotin synthase [Akkermansia sp.]